MKEGGKEGWSILEGGNKEGEKGALVDLDSSNVVGDAFLLILPPSFPALPPLPPSLPS